MNNDCKFCDKGCKNANSLRNHERLCSSNPEKQDSSFKAYHNAGKSIGRAAWNKGLDKSDPRIASMALQLIGRVKPQLPIEHKTKISSSMKKAHIENRAHNIGRSRWNNEPSYPEKFFSKVIANEFADKNVQQEFPIGRFSIDFAWPHLKKAIEMDGDQHERFEKQRESDARKDKTLKDAGWQVLRVKWKAMFKDTKDEIAKCKKFIDG